jgi:hypothetical protein
MAADRSPVAIAKRADRRRLQDRIRELAELDELMRQPGGLAEAPEPLPLHRTNRDTATERTTTS